MARPRSQQHEVSSGTSALRFLRRAYPQRVSEDNQTALMMLFGMINWTFTWLRPGGAMTCADFAEQGVAFVDRGLAA